MVITIIGVLRLLCRRCRRTGGGRQLQCHNNLKQYGLALHQYHNVYNVFPPGNVGPTGTASWT